MRRIFLIVVIIAVTFATTGAKVPQRKTNRVTNSRMTIPVQRMLGLNVVKSNNHDLIKARSIKPLQHVKSVSKAALNQSVINISERVELKATTSSVPDKLLGSFRCKGISYWGGAITGETLIKNDISDPNKIWFENLVPDGSNKSVYGTVAADQKTIIIPQGQTIFDDNTYKANLSAVDPGNIIGQFDASTGVITITSKLWGAEASDGGWFVLFDESNVTYTRTDMLPPVASYRQPQGGVFLGLDPDSWGSYNNSCIINPPNVTWNWINTNIEENVNYSWFCVDSLSGQTFSSDQDSLLMDVEDSFYSTPKLSATNEKGFSSSFILGSDYINKGYASYSKAGGNSSWLGFDENCDHSCANLDNGFTLLANSENSFYFGTGAKQFADANYESLLVYYEKPLSNLYFEGVNVYLYVFNAPANTPFTMNVVLAEKDSAGFSVKGPIVASSTIFAKDVLPVKNNNEVIGYTMKFNHFFSTDNEGFEILKESFEMDKPFYLELTGFNVDGVSLAVCTEENNPSDGDSHSGFMFRGDNSIYFWEDYRQTMYFNLSGMAYSYITVSQNSIYDNRSGGVYSIDASPYFDTLYFEPWIPNWVHVQIADEEYSDIKWGAKVNVTLDPLAANEPARYAEIVLKTVGVSKTISINQGGNVSSKEFKKPKAAFAYKTQQGIMLKYTGEMNSVTIYNVLGVIIGKYSLPETGSYQLNSSVLAKGLNFIKFQGTKGIEIIKVIQ
jgi:hypothetical protein